MALLASATAPLAAQRYWRGNLYPYVYYSTIDGFWGAVHYGRYSPVGAVERPEDNLASLSFDGGASTQGSYVILADARAPAWWEGWRVGLRVTAARANRLGYYGIGNDAAYSRDSLTAAGGGPYFYRVSRTHVAARATLQRRVAGPLRVLAGATLERTDFRPLPGPSVFRRDLAAGIVDRSTVPFTDKVVRAGVVLDTRDNELDPRTGLFAEALFASGTGYTRTTGHARVHVHPLQRVVLAGRLAVEGMGGNPPLAAQEEMEASERPFVAVGGYRSLRGYHDGRFTGRGKLLGGVEARYVILGIPAAAELKIVELKVVAFFDAGRVFGPGEAVRLTTRGLHRSGGGQLALRFLRSSLLVVGYGRGSEGGQLVFGTTWSY